MRWPAFAAAAAVGILALPIALVLLLSPPAAGACEPGATGGQPSALAETAIPRNLMPIYRAAEQKYGVPWNVLAAINRIETDFGRNLNVSSAGAQGWMQFMPATWATYGVDANGDGRKEPNDPTDAIFAAANYLKASGAPADMPTAIFAYNHAEWYVADVLDWSRKYAANPTLGDPVATGAVCASGGLDGGNTLPNGGQWLAPVPGFPGVQCDRRIVPDLTELIRRYKLHVGDCYAASGHSAAGEHPLGLGVDIHPDPSKGGTWDDVDRLARDAGWTRACGSSGVRPACPLKRAFRFVGYDGYPNHGRGHHLHISWQHGPGRPASTVTVFTGGTA